jgi:alpha/beta superfamily hydrolase
MAERLRLSGSRDVRATLDGGDGDRVVVACPPHPQMGGDRADPRLRAVSDALGQRGVGCLRIDYGAWDEGRGEQTDVHSALTWARDRYAGVGLFGYSFGGAVTLLAAAAAAQGSDRDAPDAVSALAPAATVGDGLDAAAAVAAIECPLQVVYGDRDGTADSEPVADAVHERGGAVEALPADHFFVGQRETVAKLVVEFLADWL